MCMRIGPFIVDEYGLFPAGRLRILWNDVSRPAHAELDAMVAREWARQLEQARKKGVSLYPGEMVRYLGHEVRESTMIVHGGRTDYPNFFCTNYLNWARGDEFGWDLYSNPLGVSANVITNDGWLLFGRRGYKVACHPGAVHAFGGALESEDRDPDGGFDAFGCIRREVREELHVDDDLIAEVVCLGLIRDAQIRQPELVFDVRVNCLRIELEARIGPDDEEHDAIVATRDTPDEITRLLKSSEPIVPITVASMCLHIRRCFGEKAFAEVTLPWT